ncbi:hypothetical protein DWB61_13770 [Ancylomarina euxinus]|uniref:Transglutaminase domain-containing protein n=1 Tax=Ancylomarina euxinus TaxID=2283627 RepID=A0A425XY99_9BACT|nr:hypothetical protein [Ancylomarina euxinus]MCZ4695844.1 hypothetical protein [Ancylomarina euxinus]MUP16092.1 hypothetical protein [Ancylomarina euxinus]RRG19813.1 hypothetical protein DWB61_13770 [Ancylomarina euxinus]
MKRIILFGLTLLLCNSLRAQSELKKIEVLSSNNTQLVFDHTYQKITDSLSTSDYEELKKYVLDDLKLKNTSEPEMFFELMTWVSSQWKHNGWNAADKSLTALDILKNAKAGEQYRCVEYGKVLKDVLLSFGYISRAVNLRSVDVAYGGGGMGHVATEVWSNNLQKWIFLDPQFNVYAKYQNEILNIYDIFKLKEKAEFKNIEFLNVSINELTETYPKFITRYLGYIGVYQIAKNNTYGLVLQMEGKDEYLTFQSMPSGRNVFTKNKELIYHDINRCMVIINYPENELKRSRNKMKACDIKTAEAFKENMCLFAARPNFKLSLLNNMPWFDKYEVYLNDKEIEVKNNGCDIVLPEGINELKVVVVNKIGIKGVPTLMKIRYQ